jgi:hypothetical protein
MISNLRPNRRLVCDAYASALVRRTSFSAPKPGRYPAAETAKLDIAALRLGSET